MERWSGKTAVVTGASAGIGAAIAVKLANAGLRVVGLARRTHLVDELKQKVSGSGSITSLYCDVGKAKEISSVFKIIEEKFDGIHVLVNNAGVIYPAHITDLGDSPISDDDVISTIDTNVKGLILCTKYAVASMKKQNFNGHIININRQVYTCLKNIKTVVICVNKVLTFAPASYAHSVMVLRTRKGMIELAKALVDASLTSRSHACIYFFQRVSAQPVCATFVRLNNVSGHYIPFIPNLNVYSASKHAVTAFTKALTNELACFGSDIKVTSLSPGLVRTQMVQRDGVGLEMPMLEPEHIADTVHYLLSTPPTVNITELTVLRVAEKRI